MIIPSMLLKKLYTLGSLKNAEGGVQFAVKNRLSDVELTGLRKIAVDGKDAPPDSLTLMLNDGRVLSPAQISASLNAAPLKSMTFTPPLSSRTISSTKPTNTTEPIIIGMSSFCLVGGRKPPSLISGFLKPLFSSYL
jgi:ubiquitin